jgi:hypothetical protein
MVSSLAARSERLALINRSVSFLEGLADESGNVFQMNRRGQLNITADEEKATELEAACDRISRPGGGPVRAHSSSSLYYQPSPPEGNHDLPTGLDSVISHEYREYTKLLED